MEGVPTSLNFNYTGHSSSTGLASAHCCVPVTCNTEPDILWAVHSSQVHVHAPTSRLQARDDFPGPSPSSHLVPHRSGSATGKTRAPNSVSLGTYPMLETFWVCVSKGAQLLNQGWQCRLEAILPIGAPSGSASRLPALIMTRKFPEISPPSAPTWPMSCPPSKHWDWTLTTPCHHSLPSSLPPPQPGSP